MEKELGKEGKLSIGVKDGKVVLSAKLDTSGVDVELKAELDGDYFMDKLAEAIPGKIDDAVIALLKGALKGVTV